MSKKVLQPDELKQIAANIEADINVSTKHVYRIRSLEHLYGLQENIYLADVIEEGVASIHVSFAVKVAADYSIELVSTRTFQAPDFTHPAQKREQE